MNKQHPESWTRGLHVTKAAKNTRGLRSHQAGSADPDEQKTPRVTDSGAARHQDGENIPGGCAIVKPALQTRTNKKHPKSRTRGLHFTKVTNKSAKRRKT